MMFSWIFLYYRFTQFCTSSPSIRPRCFTFSVATGSRIFFDDTHQFISRLIANPFSKESITHFLIVGCIRHFFALFFKHRVGKFDRQSQSDSLTHRAQRVPIHTYCIVFSVCDCSCHNLISYKCSSVSNSPLSLPINTRICWIATALSFTSRSHCGRPSSMSTALIFSIFDKHISSLMVA